MNKTNGNQWHQQQQHERQQEQEQEQADKEEPLEGKGKQKLPPPQPQRQRCQAATDVKTTCAAKGTGVQHQSEAQRWPKLGDEQSVPPNTDNPNKLV